MTKSHFDNETQDQILDRFRDGATIHQIVSWLSLEKRAINTNIITPQQRLELVEDVIRGQIA